MLDNLTLQAQLALLKKNEQELAADTDNKTRQLQELSIVIERQRGALAYNAVLIKQLEAQIAENAKATPPSQ